MINHPGVSTFLQNAMIIGKIAISQDKTYRAQVLYIVGADVGHPGPGIKTQPSITGIVATLDPEASVMTSFSSIQPPRQELILDLEDMIMVSTN